METQDLSNLLEASQRALQAEYAASGAAAMGLVLADLIRHKPVICLPESPLYQVLETMRRKAVGSVVVTNNHGVPLGIFTRHDVLDRVALAAGAVARDAPIAGLMSAPLVTLPAQATAHDAALLMVQRGVRHIPLLAAGKLVGVISERDLFKLQRIAPRSLANALRAAPDVASLQQLGGEIRELARNLLAQSIAAAPLTQLLSSLNDILARRVIEIAFSESDASLQPFCWIALGSEGRAEQTSGSHQNNGIIFDLPEHATLGAMKKKLLPVAKRINHALDECGFPLSKGNIMAGNLMWCLSLDEWKKKFSDWINNSSAEALLHTPVFFDFRPIYGNAQLAVALRDWLNRQVSHPRFLHDMAANALHSKPPLGPDRDIAVETGGEHGGTLDLKLHGSVLFVDAARIYALAGGSSETGTLARFKAAADAQKLPEKEVESWVQAFMFLQLLRLRCQHPDSTVAPRADNRLNPDSLSDLDRRILREVFLQAQSLQHRLARDFQV